MSEVLRELADELLLLGSDEAETDQVLRELGGLQALVADAPPVPSPDLAALLGAGQPARPPLSRRTAARRSGAVGAALAVLVSGVGATGLSAAANTLPGPVQERVATFSRSWLPFHFPQPSERTRDPLGQSSGQTSGQTSGLPRGSEPLRPRTDRPDASAAQPVEPPATSGTTGSDPEAQASTPAAPAAPAALATPVLPTAPTTGGGAATSSGSSTGSSSDGDGRPSHAGKPDTTSSGKPAKPAKPTEPRPWQTHVLTSTSTPDGDDTTEVDEDEVEAQVEAQVEDLADEVADDVRGDGSSDDHPGRHLGLDRGTGRDTP